tara:strand:- start:836 stop:985 length:150 start_codon:yes stop_codon:yes gene_type:complete
LTEEPDIYFCFHLGEILHKSLDEIMELSTLEIKLWSAYFDLKNEKMKNG